MKRLLIFTVVTLLWMVSVKVAGQNNDHKLRLGTRSLKIEELNFINFSTQYIIPADIAAANVIDNFSNNVSIFSIVGYPISMFLEDNVNLNNYFESQKQVVNSQNPNSNYILFLTAKMPDGRYEGRFYAKINNEDYTAVCQNKNELINTFFTKTYSDKVKSVSDNEVYKAIAETLESLDLFLGQGCVLDGKDEENYYKLLGYEIFNITGYFGTIEGDPNALKRIKNNTGRTECPSVLDKSKIIFRYPDGSTKDATDALLTPSSYLEFPALFTITSYLSDPLDLAVPEAINSNTCDILFQIFIPAEYNNTQKLFVKTTVEENSSTFEEYNYNNLREKFDNDQLFEYTKITFRIKDHPELWEYLVNPNNFNLMEAGFKAGFVDGLLGDVSMITGLLGYVVEASPNFQIQSMFLFSLQKESFQNGLVEYDLRQYMLKLVADQVIDQIKNFIMNPSEILTVFAEIIENKIEYYKNEFTFVAGDFNAGYTAGKDTYTALSLVAGGYGLALKTGKGVLALGNGVQKSVLKAAEMMKKGLKSEDVLKALDESGVVINKGISLSSDVINGLKTYFINGTEVGTTSISNAGYLSFDIKIPAGLQKQGYATLIINDAIKYFENQNKIIKGINGKWLSLNSYEGGMSTNLKSFIDDFLHNDKSFEYAALNTPTGKIVEKLGYSKVSKVDWDILDLGGPKPTQIYWIELKFTKP